MPPVIAAIAAFAVAHPWIALGIGIAVNVGISFVQRALAPKLKAPSLAAQQGRELSVRQSDSPWQIVYGEQRIGGSFGFLHTTADNQYFYCCLLLCYGGPDGIESIDKVFFGDEEITFDGAGNATGKYAGYVTLEKKLGTDGQAASSILTTDVPAKWGATDTFGGHALIVLKIKWNQDLFADFTMESIRCQVKGRKVFDPRTGQVAYTTNPVLIARDYATNKRFGLGADADEMDDAFNNLGANICEEQVKKKAGGTRNRYAVNFAFLVDREPGRILEELRRSMAGAYGDVGGKLQIRPGAWRPPSITIKEKDLVGPVKMKTALGRAALVNGFKGTYIETTNFQPTTYPAYAPANVLAEDGGIRLWETLDFPFVTDPEQCQQLAKIELMRRRKQKRAVLHCKMLAYELVCGATLQFENTQLGMAKAFYVDRLDLHAMEEGAARGRGGPVQSVMLHTREETPDIYYFDPAVDVTTPVAAGTGTFPNPSSVGVLTNLVLTSNSSTRITLPGGMTQPRVRATWDPASDYFVASGGKIEIQMRTPTGVGAWIPVDMVDGADVEFYIPMSAGQSLDVRIRPHNAARVRGGWTTVTNHVVEAGSTGTILDTATDTLDDVPDGPTFARPLASILSGGRVRQLRRSDASDIDTDNVFRRGTDTAADVVATGARTFVNPSYVDGSLRPNLLRRSASDVDPNDLTKTTEVTSHIGGSGVATIALDTKTTGDFPTGRKVGGSSGIESARVADVIIDNSGVGQIKPQRHAASIAGKKTAGEIIADGTTASSPGWIALATVDFQVPAGVSSIDFFLEGYTNAGSNVVKFDTGVDNRGIAIHTGSAPASPTVSRTGDGTVTYSSPSGDKLTVYAKTTTGVGGFTTVGVRAKQDTTKNPAGGGLV